MSALHRRLGGLSIGTALLVAGCKPSGQESLLRGDAALNAGQPVEAIQWLERAAELLPSDAEVWNRLGLAYHQAGRLDEASKAYGRSLHFNRDLFDVHFNLGELLLEQGRHREADASFRTYLNASADHSRNAAAWRGLGLALQGQRQHPTAEAALANAVRLDPSDALAWNALGVSKVQLRKPRDAQAAFQKAAQLDPQLATARLNLAIVLQQYLANPREALAQYQAFLQLQGDGPEADSARVAVRDLSIRLGLAPATNASPATARRPATNAPAATGPASAAASGAVPALGATAGAGSATGGTVPAAINAGPAIPSRPTNGVIVAARPFVPAPPKSPATNAALVSTTSQPPKAAPPTDVASQPTPPAVQPPAQPKATDDGTGALPAVSPPAVPTPPPVTIPPPPPAPVAAKPPAVAAPVPPPATPLEIVTVRDEPPPRPAVDPPANAAEVVAALPTVQALASKPIEDQGKDPGEATDPGSDDAMDDAQAPEAGGSRRTVWQRMNPTSWGNPVRWFRKEPAAPGASVPKPRPSREPARATTPPAAPAKPAGTIAAKPRTAAPLVTPLDVDPEPRPTFTRYRRTIQGPPTPGNATAAQAEFLRGTEAHGRGEAALAMGAYRKAITIDPAHFASHYNLSLLALQQGDLGEALRSAELAVAIDPASHVARYNFAVALQRSRHAIDAAEELERITRDQPSEANAHLALASLCDLDLRDVPRARAHYQKVLAVQPRHPKADFIRSWLERHPGP